MVQGLIWVIEVELCKFWQSLLIWNEGSSNVMKGSLYFIDPRSSTIIDCMVLPKPDPRTLTHRSHGQIAVVFSNIFSKFLCPAILIMVQMGPRLDTLIWSLLNGFLAKGKGAMTGFGAGGAGGARAGGAGAGGAGGAGGRKRDLNFDGD